MKLYQSYDHISQIDTNIYFGKYPCNQVLEDLNKLDIQLIVNLTTTDENLDSYNTEIPIINKPIIDRKILPDNELIQFIELLQKYISKPIYIHCKGGHGRSGVVVGYLYGITNNLSYYAVSQELKIAHNRRKIVNTKCRKLGCPQTRCQKEQLKRLLKK